MPHAEKGLLQIPLLNHPNNYVTTLKFISGVTAINNARHIERADKNKVNFS